jgi:hypothetical protein
MKVPSIVPQLTPIIVHDLQPVPAKGGHDQGSMSASHGDDSPLVLTQQRPPESFLGGDASTTSGVIKGDAASTSTSASLPLLSVGPGPLPQASTNVNGRISRALVMQKRDAFLAASQGGGL